MSDADEDFFDLDAAAAEQRAKRQPFRFRWGGRKWEMGNIFTLDLELIEQAENGDITAIRKALQDGLGDQYADFRAHGVGIDAFALLFEKWVAASGSSPGESGASSDSSESTERPSKPTSNGGTESSSVKPSGDHPTSGAPPASS